MFAANVTGYLKWADTVIGEIVNHREVIFVDYITGATSKKVIDLLTKGAGRWNEEQYARFLTDRIVSPGRRDIERILFRLGLSSYDAIKIAEKTYAINPKDLFWVSPHRETNMAVAIEDTFKKIFKITLDKNGATMQSPDGQNIKDYGVNKGRYGIFKRRLSDVMTDAESEVAVYELSKILGIPVCPAWFVDKDTIFSKFEYNFTSEYLVHIRHFFRDGARTGNQYCDLVNRFPKLKKDIAKMCLLDFITRQDDRHLSNIAILIHAEKESFYPLYDNGRSLFFDCGESLVNDSIADIPAYSTSFGEVGTYYDVVKDISKEFKIPELINLNIGEDEIVSVLKESRFAGYRLEGSRRWILGALDLLKNF